MSKIFGGPSRALPGSVQQIAPESRSNFKETLTQKTFMASHRCGTGLDWDRKQKRGILSSTSAHWTSKKGLRGGLNPICNSSRALQYRASATLEAKEPGCGSAKDSSMDEDKPKTILIVDDQEDDQGVLSWLLGRVGVINPIICLRDGHEALRYLNGETPYADLKRFPFPAALFLDLQMPVM